MAAKQKKATFDEKDGIDSVLTFLIWFFVIIAVVCLLLYFNNRGTRELFDWLNPETQHLQVIKTREAQ